MHIATTQTECWPMQWSGMALEHGKNAAIRVMNAAGCQNLPDFYSVFGQSFEFPAYFGFNWNAFDEMINDLEWMVSDAYISVFTNAHQLLERAPPQDFQHLLECLTDAHESWKSPNRFFPRDRPPTLFATVLLCPQKQKRALVSRLPKSVRRRTRVYEHFCPPAKASDI